MPLGGQGGIPTGGSGRCLPYGGPANPVEPSVGALVSQVAIRSRPTDWWEPGQVSPKRREVDALVGHVRSGAGVRAAMRVPAAIQCATPPALDRRSDDRPGRERRAGEPAAAAASALGRLRGPSNLAVVRLNPPFRPVT